MSTWNPQIEAYCSQQVFQEALGIEDPVCCSFLAQGEYNINYRVDAIDASSGAKKSFVFRLNTASQLQLDNQIQYEYKALKALAPSGVTPVPLYLDDTKSHFPYGLLCMEYLEGRPLEYGRDLHHAARLFAGIHSMDTAGFDSFLIKEQGLCHARVEEGRRWLEDYYACPEAPLEIKRLFHRFVEHCDQASKADSFFEANPWQVVNNTEVNSHNFIIGEASQYIIDWEKPVISDPVQDITQFLAPTTTLWRSDYLLSDEEINHFYALYQQFSVRDAKDLRERVDIYRPFLYLRALSWCANAWVAYHGERVIHNPRTFEKIKSYLEPEFMRRLLREYI